MPKSEKPRRCTLLDIAQRTGFTVNTVSRALKDKSDISVATREQIKAVADEMGYVRNRAASSLRSGRTNLNPCFSQAFCKLLRKYPFATTPPPAVTVSTPFSSAAATVFSTSTSTAALWKEAATSALE